MTNEQQNETRAAAGEEPAQPAVKQESPAETQESAPAKEATATEETPEEEAPQAEEAQAPAAEEAQAEEPETPAEEAPQAEEPQAPAEEAPQAEEPEVPAEEKPQAEEPKAPAEEMTQTEEAETPAEEPELFAKEAPQAKAPAPEAAGESLPAGAKKAAAPQEGFVFQALYAPLEAAGEKRAAVRDGAQPAAGGRSERQPQPGPGPAAAESGTWQQAELAGARRPHAQPQKPQRSESAAQVKAAPRRKNRAACAVLAVAALLAAGGIGYSVRLLQESLLAAAEPASVSVSVSVVEEEPEAPDLTATEADGSIGILRLANTQHPLPDGYVPPNLETMDGEGRQLDARAAQPLRDMIAAARADGCQLVLSSGYRSYERQEELFAMMIVDYLNLGYSYGDAYAATKNLRNIPGTSEHQTGLAADIVAADYWTMDDGYAETDEAKWLVEHAADYGFILRYPADKEHITGTHFEPWHYRYVGVEDAQKIMAAGVCLEEYLGAVE